MQQNEILSAYMDGQKVADDFAEKIAGDPALKQKWASYHTIRSVMQGEEILLGNDFSAKMEALLENEEFEKGAEQPRGRGVLLKLKLKRWSMPLMQAGIAASVCLVAVLGVNFMNASDEVVQNEGALQTIPFLGNAGQAVSYNAPEKDLATNERLEQQQRLIDALLQNHELQQRRPNENDATGVSKKEKAQTSSTDNIAQP